MNFTLSFSLPEYATNIQLIVIAMAVGIVIAGAMSIYYRSLLGRFVRYLLKNKIHSPDAALSIDDSPYKKNPFIRSALRSGGVYGKVVHFTDGEASGSVFASGKRPSKKVVAARKYYIPEELRYRAEFMFESKGTNIPTLIISIIILAAFVLLCLYFLPQLLALLEVAYGKTETRGGV